MRIQQRINVGRKCEFTTIDARDARPMPSGMIADFAGKLPPNHADVAPSPTGSERVRQSRLRESFELSRSANRSSPSMIIATFEPCGRTIVVHALAAIPAMPIGIVRRVA